MTTTVPSPATSPEAVQAAIADVPRRMVAAWAAHDADAFADLFVENGYMILPGVHGAGKEAIRSFMATAFLGQYENTQVTGTPIGLSFLAPGAAVLVTHGGVLHDGETEVTAERAIRASWIVVEHDGVWKVAGYQNSPANPA